MSNHNPTRAPPLPRTATYRCQSSTSTALLPRTTQRGPDDAHLDAAQNPAIMEGEGASELDNTLLRERGKGEAGGAHVAAQAAPPAAAAMEACPLAAAPLSDAVVARRVVARWRAFVAERKGVLLVGLLGLPDLFEREVLKQLDHVGRTMVAQVGRPWLAAVLASGLPRLPKGRRVRLQVRGFCTSAERLAWAKANGCPWRVSHGDMWFNVCEFAAAGGHLEALRWAREHGCPWDVWTCHNAADGGHLEALRWAREHGCPWGAMTCRCAAVGGHLEVLRWARAHGCPWIKHICVNVSRHHPETRAWVQQQPE